MVRSAGTRFRLPDKRRPVPILTRNDVIDSLNEIIVVGRGGMFGRRRSGVNPSRTAKLDVVSSVSEIEDAVRRLSAAEFAAFRTWFAEFDADAWDRQIERDIVSGRLDALADEALDDLRAGRCTER